MATYYVDTDVVGGLADGSSWTNAFSSLSAYITARGTVTLSAPEIVYCRGATNADTTTNLAFTNITTSATNTLTIEVPQEFRHDGKWNTGKYRLVGPDANYQHIMNIADKHIIIDGVQFEVDFTHTEGTAIAAIQADGSTASVTQTIKNCIIRRTGGGNTRAIKMSNSCNIWNNVAYDFNTSEGANPSKAIELYPVNGATLNIYNNTVHNSLTGIEIIGYSTGTVNIKNNLCNSNTVDYYSEGGYTRNSATNISEDSTSFDVAFRTKAVSFVNEASDDFHLDAADTNAKDQGTDLSGTFTTDIDGQTRSGTWDIGADEYVAASTSCPNFVLLGVGSIGMGSGWGVKGF